MADLSTEMLCLRAIRNSRAMFREEVVRTARIYRAAYPLEGANSLSPEEVQAFESDGLEQLAELLFVQSDLELNKDPVRVERFLLAHNEDMSNLIDSLTSQKLSKLEGGTSLTALRRSLFTDERIADLKVSARFGGAFFSQSDLGRILVCLMSPETCRKYLELLGDCGFIVREGSSAKPIRTLGVIEELYRAHLRRIVAATQSIGQPLNREDEGF